MRVPLAVKLLIGLGLLAVVNEQAPGLVPRILLLVALYLVLTNWQQVATLVAQVPAGLERTVGRTYVTPGSGIGALGGG